MPWDLSRDRATYLTHHVRCDRAAYAATVPRTPRPRHVSRDGATYAATAPHTHVAQRALLPSRPPSAPPSRRLLLHGDRLARQLPHRVHLRGHVLRHEVVVCVGPPAYCALPATYATTVLRPRTP